MRYVKKLNFLKKMSFGGRPKISKNIINNIGREFLIYLKKDYFRRSI